MYLQIDLYFATIIPTFSQTDLFTGLAQRMYLILFLNLACLVLVLRGGYLRAILMCLRLKEGSVLSAGPPCSSFVFLNSFTSGRRAWRPFGFPSLREYVRVANVNLDLISNILSHFNFCESFLKKTNLIQLHDLMILFSIVEKVVI